MQSKSENRGASVATAIVAGGVAEDLREAEAGLTERVEQVLEEARRQGATAAEVGVSRDVGLAVTVRRGELEGVECTRDQGFGISVYVGQRKGSASTTDGSLQAVRDTVAKAVNIARYTAEDEAAGLAPAELLADALPDLDLFHGWPLDVQAARELALRCEIAALEADERISNSDGATVSSHQGCRAYGNSHGFVGSYCSTRHGFGVGVIAGEGPAMQRDHWSSVRRDPAALEDPQAVGRRAAQRAVAALGARPISTRKAPILFDSDVATTLIGHFLGAISGGNLYRRSSFLLDQLGESLFPQGVSLFERPFLPGALGSAAFDGDGVATRDQDFVRDGRLERYLLSAYSARRLGLQTTGNAGGVHNLHVVDQRAGQQDLTFDDLLARLGTGLLVTQVMGQGVNMVTGDYSRGASGFWVEDGAIAFPVAEVTIASNLARMYAGIDAIGTDVAHPGNILTGSILIDEMMIAGA